MKSAAVKEFREFWIEQFNGRIPPSFYAFKDKPKFNKLKLKLNVSDEEIEASEYFHVIEYQALIAERARSNKLIEALEFVTMPITNPNPTVKGLLETMEVDRQKALEALEEYSKSTESGE